MKRFMVIDAMKLSAFFDELTKAVNCARDWIAVDGRKYVTIYEARTVVRREVSPILVEPYSGKKESDQKNAALKVTVMCLSGCTHPNCGCTKR